MPTRNASARWEGGLKGGSGRFELGGGLAAPYSFGTRFEEEPGTNPEELIAAAHASCFSMALSGRLEKAGTPASSIATTAKVTLGQVEGGFAITSIALHCEATVPGVDEDAFQAAAQDAKANCPVSKALAAVGDITLDARLTS